MRSEIQQFFVSSLFIQIKWTASSAAPWRLLEPHVELSPTCSVMFALVTGSKFIHLRYESGGAQ